jgi:hypothetical protein
LPVNNATMPQMIRAIRIAKMMLNHTTGLRYQGAGGPADPRLSGAIRAVGSSPWPGGWLRATVADVNSSVGAAPPARYAPCLRFGAARAPGVQWSTCSGCSSSDAAAGSDPDRLPVAGVRDAPV